MIWLQIEFMGVTDWICCVLMSGCRCKYGARFKDVFILSGAVLPIWKQVVDEEAKTATRNTDGSRKKKACMRPHVTHCVDSAAVKSCDECGTYKCVGTVFQCAYHVLLYIRTLQYLTTHWQLLTGCERRPYCVSY
jgi:hypothetical protein